jgi:hypothetical protein
MSAGITGGMSKVMVVRLDAKTFSKLAGAAKREDLPVARLARIFVTFGLAKLEQGQAEIERAVKSSRDTAVRRTVKPSRDR